jgi:hypothetical protein
MEADFGGTPQRREPLGDEAAIREGRRAAVTKAPEIREPPGLREMGTTSIQIAISAKQRRRRPVYAVRQRTQNV